MDKVWEELYTEACRLQGEKKLSRYMRVGSVAAALITTNGIYPNGVNAIMIIMAVNSAVKTSS